MGSTVDRESGGVAGAREQRGGEGGGSTRRGEEVTTSSICGRETRRGEAISSLPDYRGPGGLTGGEGGVSRWGGGG